MKMKKNKKPKKAVAIKYTKEDFAPLVVAKGQGYKAEKILETAKEHTVKTHKDEKLVEELTKIDLGDHIPKELYLAVAQVLVFINDLDKKHMSQNTMKRG